ncbi:histidinol dehydrogenase [Candidatus Vidania fulgoroideorum]
MINLLGYSDLRRFTSTNYSSSSHRLVNRIIRYVIKYGDDAIIVLSRKYDYVNMVKNSISSNVNNIDFSHLDLGIKESLLSCRNKIISFHKNQQKKIGIKSWFIKNNLGNVFGQVCTSIRSIGVYIPGGKKIYPSSVLMNCIPAMLAGVKHIYACTPASINYSNLPVFYALKILGVDRLYNIGGAQAIAALAFGTKRIRKVDKIIGPGNRFVNIAKRLVFGSVGIDMLAGPTEIGIFFCKHISIRKIIYELFSQIEHDENCLSFLVSNSRSRLLKLYFRITSFLNSNFNDIRLITISRSFSKTLFFYNKDIRICFKIANFLAPEHFSLLLKRPFKYISSIKTPGSIFLGRNNSESYGDYSIGTNHVLPTNKCSRFSSVLNINDFKLLKNISFISSNDIFLSNLSSRLSKIENLFFHYKNSIC